jgi:hypothetical protein
MRKLRIVQLNLAILAATPPRGLLCRSLRAKRRVGGENIDEADKLDGPREAEREVVRSFAFRWRRLVVRVDWGTSLMYKSTASLFQRPRSLISSLGMPFAAAVTAAPFRSE